MLSDEEKQAIEKLDWYFEDSTGLDIEKQIRIILNLIEKQSKEIEEAEQKEKKAYIDGTNVAHELCNKYWQDKIKAKIEEVKDGTFDAKIVLQSLLEKE